MDLFYVVEICIGELELALAEDLCDGDVELGIGEAGGMS